MKFPRLEANLAALFLGSLLFLTSFTTLGCSSSTSTTSDPADGASGETVKPAEVLLEPFDPPTLEEIDAKAEWVDRPVIDALELLRQHQQKEPQPELSAEQALALKNDSPENNAKITAAMGRLPASDSDVNYDATLTRHLLGDVRSTNPILQSSVQEFDYHGLTNFGLFGFDWELNPFATAETVKSWQSSKDSMFDKVVIRDDLTWSDGKPITAHDVVFSFQTIMNPNVPVPAVRTGTDKLRWVHAYDDHTLVYFQKEASAVNNSYLNFPVIPKHIYADSVDRDPTLQNDPHHVKYENNPVTGGLYEVTKRTRNQEIVCTRRESYYMHAGKEVRAKPYFKEVRLKIIQERNVALIALKSAQLDELELSVDQWLGQTASDDYYRRNTKGSGVEWTSFHINWNLNTPFFSDKRVRHAMAYALDHREMLTKLLSNLYMPCTGPYHPSSWMAPKTPSKPFQQDLDKAESLLDEAGWTDSDGDGTRDKTVNGVSTPFEFSLIVRDDPERKRIAELMKFNLDQIGIKCNIAVIELTVMQERMQNKSFQAALAGWGTGADPFTSENIFMTGEGRNYGSYSNPEVDKLFNQGRMELDRTKRGEIYARIHELIYEDQPYTFLYYRNSFYGFNKELRGWNFSPRGPYHYGPGLSSIWRVTAN